MSRTISARIPDSLFEQLESAAADLGVGLSEVIIRSIHAYLQTVTNRPSAPINVPQTPINSPATDERLARLEARLAALEMAVFTRSDSHTEGIPDTTTTPEGIPESLPSSTPEGISESVQTPVDGLAMEIPEPSTTTPEGIPELSRLSVQELRKLASQRGIPKYWVLGKAALLAELK